MLYPCHSAPVTWYYHLKWVVLFVTSVASTHASLLVQFYSRPELCVRIDLKQRYGRHIVHISYGCHLRRRASGYNVLSVVAVSLIIIIVIRLSNYLTA